MPSGSMWFYLFSLPFFIIRWIPGVIIWKLDWFAIIIPPLSIFFLTILRKTLWFLSQFLRVVSLILLPKMSAICIVRCALGFMLLPVSSSSFWFFSFLVLIIFFSVSSLSSWTPFISIWWIKIPKPPPYASTVFVKVRIKTGICFFRFSII